MNLKELKKMKWSNEENLGQDLLRFQPQAFGEFTCYVFSDDAKTVKEVKTFKNARQLEVYIFGLEVAGNSGPRNQIETMNSL